MPIEKEAVLRDIDAVLAETPPEAGHTAIAMLSGLYASCIERFAEPGSTYVRHAAATMADDRMMHAGRSVAILKGLVLALRNDVAGDRLRSFTELVHAAVFADLLATAEHFVESSYLMPAAVMAGGTLEEHLRELATKHGIPTTVTKNGRTKPKEASALNDELCAQAKAYLQTEQAQNQGWLHIRNMAAHNEPDFAKVTEPQVTAMIEGIRAFISRHPA